MKTQTYIVEVTDLTGQFQVDSARIKDALEKELPDSYRINVNTKEA